VLDEFQLITRYFDRQREAPGVAVGIGDDGAVLMTNAAFDQIQVIDTLVAGVHFPRETNPADIAYRAVAVNLSDMAAMGGRPLWMTLALTLVTSDGQWLQQFANGLFEVADAFDLALVGGDTTRGDILVVTVSLTGEVERGKALLRSGARPGDTIFVTGSLGDAGAGLQCLQGHGEDKFLRQRFLRPTPRVEIGRALIGKASAAIDLSDGLLGDLAKLLSASSVGADIDIERLPLSKSLRANRDIATQRHLALTAGDDYELCFTATQDAVSGIEGITAIGSVTDGSELICRQGNTIVEIEHSGYRHFQ